LPELKALNRELIGKVINSP